LPAVDSATERLRLAERLAAAVRQAGELALSKFRSPLKSWMKGNASPVCEADIAVNELLQDRLRIPAEDIGWLSEESLDDPARLQTRQLWVVDPIDGTRAYIGGRPDWSISAALVENGRPIVAAIFAPVANEMFLAAAGEGATLNDSPIRASTGGVSGARFAAPAHYLKRLQAIDGSIIAHPKIHSLALRFARVAQGAIDVAFASGNSHDWDLAAADLLVHEAGGALTTFAGQLLIYNRTDPVHAPLVAAGRDRHAALVAMLRDRRIESA
jgi:myo-inositol-1(or 4)-monophosphatase